MLRHACGYALANKGHDPRAIQGWLGHRSITSTAVHTALAQGFLAGVKTSGVGGTLARNVFPSQQLCNARDVGWPTFTDESMSEEFACPVCDSPAIVYPEEGEEDRIVCGGCGAFVATRDQFRRLVERHAEVQTSGC
jgi:hypothetical protein